MSEPKFSAGWDAARVQRLIDHYEGLSDDEQAAEDEAAVGKRPGQVVVTVPEAALPAIRQLLTTYKDAASVVVAGGSRTAAVRGNG